jgi:hypothetical protein
MSVSGGWKSKCLKGFTGRDSKTYAASGALSLNVDLAILDGSAAVCAMTLANGDEGQRILVVCKDATNACSVTPASGTAVTLLANDTAEYVFNGSSWVVAGGTAVVKTETTYVADGAIALTDDVAILDGSEATCEMTLADGEEGQRILIVCADSTEVCDVTPASFTDGTDLTFTADEMAELVYVNGSWLAVGGYTAELDAS